MELEIDDDCVDAMVIATLERVIAYARNRDDYGEAFIPACQTVLHHFGVGPTASAEIITPPLETLTPSSYATGLFTREQAGDVMRKEFEKDPKWSKWKDIASRSRRAIHGDKFDAPDTPSTFLSRAKAWYDNRPKASAVAWVALFVGLFLPPLIPLDEIIGVATAWRGPAVGFHELTLVTPSVRVGQPLILNVRGEYLRSCMWRWTQRWNRLAPDGEQAVAMNWMPGNAHAIGIVTDHDLALTLPVGITPGEYVLYNSGTAECGHGDVAQIIDPPLHFTVTAVDGVTAGDGAKG